MGLCSVFNFLINGISTGLNVLSKLCNVAEAATEIYSLYQKDKWSDQEKVNVTAQIIFMSLQVVDIKASCNDNCHIKLGSKIAVGLADVSRKVTQTLVEKDSWERDDVLKVVQIALFRANDSLASAVNLPSNSYGYKHKIEQIGQLTGLGNGLVSLWLTSGKIAKIGPCTQRIYKYLISRHNNHSNFNAQPFHFSSEQEMTSLIPNDKFLKFLRKRSDANEYLCPLSGEYISNPIKCLTEPTLFVEEQAIQEMRKQEKTEMEIKGKTYLIKDFDVKIDENEKNKREISWLKLQEECQEEEENQNEDMLHAIQNWKTLKNIPNVFHADPRFNKLRCKITNNPIRKIVTPALDDAKVKGAYFEKRIIKSWIRDKPNEAPPSWPVDILPLPMQKEYLKKSILLQSIIDTNLESLAEELRPTNT